MITMTTPVVMLPLFLSSYGSSISCRWNKMNYVMASWLVESSSWWWMFREHRWRFLSRKKNLGLMTVASFLIDLSSLHRRCALSPSYPCLDLTLRSIKRSICVMWLARLDVISVFFLRLSTVITFYFSNTTSSPLPLSLDDFIISSSSSLISEEAHSYVVHMG
jgi:hypothetical protein